MFGDRVVHARSALEIAAQGDWNHLISQSVDGLVPLAALQERVRELSRDGCDERAEELEKYASSCRE